MPLVVFLAILFIGNAAFALEPGPPTHVNLPIGEWIMAAAGIIVSIATPIIAYAAKKALGPLSLFVSADAVDRLVQNAVKYALNYVEGAAQGKELKVELGSQVLAVAVNYALDKIAPSLLEWIGGVEGLKEKIFRQLPLPPEASAQAVGMAPTYGSDKSGATIPATSLPVGPSPTR